jgi:UDP-N-acetylglucosamine transferase subunit ALG13
MIFVTVGSVFGFDRLIKAMDSWAQENKSVEVFAQIGDGGYVPKNMRWTKMLLPAEFKATTAAAKLIVAHAGMGSFFTAMEVRKPIVMMPRLADLNEHTTDHQVHTLNWLKEKPGVFAAHHESELPRAVAGAMSSSSQFENFSPFAPAPFVDRLRAALLS